jgi:DNA polymerase III delta subunit
MLYIIYGNEPWALKIQKERFRESCPNVEYGYGEGDSLAEAVSFLSSFNLMADSLRYCLSVDDTKSLTEKSALSFLEGLKEDNKKYLLIIIKKVTEKDRGLAKLKEFSVVASYQKLSGNTALDKADEIARQQGAVFEQGALRALMERLDYKNREETNLLTVENYISQLKYISCPITLDDVERNVPDLREGKRFQLAALICSGNKAKLMEEAERLKAERDFSAFGILAILQKEYRVAYLAKLGYSPREQGAFSNSFKSYSEEELVRGLSVIAEAIRSIKTGIYSEKQAFDVAIASLVNHKGV